MMRATTTNTGPAKRSRPATFEFEALEGLPCGCVAVAYRSRLWDVTLVSLDAKGPHCVFAGHRAGQVIHFGEPDGLDDEDGEE
jgi:hypothetical protein